MNRIKYEISSGIHETGPLSADRCEGCDRAIYSFAGPVCLACCKARHRAVLNSGRCTCGRRARPTRKGRIVMFGRRDIGRKWIACLRCLGTIKQFN